MSIPSAIDSELVLSQIGSEQNPSSIIVNGTMWTVFEQSGVVNIREYESVNRQVFELNDQSSFYTISPAFISGSVSTTRFFLWTVENEELYVEFIEPIVGESPVKTNRTLIDSNVTELSVDIHPTMGARIAIVDKTTANRGLVYKEYYDVLGAVVREEELAWPGTREDQISIQSTGNDHDFLAVFTQVLSPPNVYEELTPLPPPVFDPVEIRSVDVDSLDVRVSLNRNGNAYLVVLPDGATAPTSEQVKAGQDATSTPLAANLTDTVALVADVENGVGTFVATGLFPLTDYDVYVVAEDEFLNIQVTPTKLDVTTIANPQIYFVSAAGSATPPYTNPSIAHNSISALKAAIGGFYPGDIVEVVKAGDIIELATIEPESDDITIRSYGTNGTDRQRNKPVVKTSAPVLFDAVTAGSLNFIVRDLDIIPQPGCSRVYAGVNGEFRGNIIRAQNASSGDSMVYAKYGFKGRNNLLDDVPDSAFIIDDSDDNGTESVIFSNTIYGFNGPAIRVEAGDVKAYNNLIHGRGVAGTIALSKS